MKSQLCEGSVVGRWDNLLVGMWCECVMFYFPGNGSRCGHQWAIILIASNYLITVDSSDSLWHGAALNVRSRFTVFVEVVQCANHVCLVPGSTCMLCVCVCVCYPLTSDFTDHASLFCLTKDVNH